MRNIVFIHGGGPTAVINASLAGSLRELRDQGFDGKVYGARFGVRGLLARDMIDLGKLSDKELDALEHTPGSAIGTGRDHLEGEDYLKLRNALSELDAAYCVMTGGNGTMDTCRKLAFACDTAGITVTGTPKTMDNDLSVTDHSPGFGSAARYIAASVREAVEDVNGLPIHAVVIEAFGRDAGWITASSALSRLYGSDGPDMVLPPESAFDEECFLSQVERIHKEKGGLVIVASEGLRYSDGTPIVEPIFQTDRSVYFGDVSSHLASLIVKKLGIKARSEKPGILGRSSIAWQSDIDRMEAVECGRASVRAALSGRTASMSIIRRISSDSYKAETAIEDISDEILEARTLPAEYYDAATFSVSESFIEYARPLTGPLGPEFISLQRKEGAL